MQSQQNEAGLVLENDLFSSSVNDKYYTNGIEIFYRKLSVRTSEKVAKSTHEFRLGQYIYNPQTVQAADPNYHDRPFAGLLSARYTRTWFYTSGSVLKIAADLGIIGAESGAEATQKLIHDTFNYKEVSGWNYQIKTTPSAGVRAQFVQPLASGQNLDLAANADAVAGTAFSSASAGVTSRISLWPLTPRRESVLYGGALRSKKDQMTPRELFFYISPGISYQIYDATIEGGPFNDRSPVTWDLVPLRFTGEAGIRYRTRLVSLSYAFVYKSKEVDNWVNVGHYYGSISVSRLF